MTVLGLADIVNMTVFSHGDKDFPPSGQGNVTGFTTSYPPSLLELLIVAQGALPVYAVSDLLKGIQELTHYLTVQEMTFEIFNNISDTTSPVAAGCLAFDCGGTDPGLFRPYQSNATQVINASMFSPKTSSSPSSSTETIEYALAKPSAIDIEVSYTRNSQSLPLRLQNFADVSTEVL
ncbi:hypothetical protein MMC28_010065 [Mycoblastus sanguinarius]|nr:hypothetical protein [Mycoblastus sanguinarius]